MITHILVVDDNVDAADSLAMLLQLAGHDAKVAYSSEAALAFATSFSSRLCIAGHRPARDGRL